MKKGIYRGNRYYKSSLDIYKGEILTMYRTGHKISEINFWLERKKIHVNWTTVYRFINKYN